MAGVLDGLFVWIWNFARCDGGDYDAIAARLKAAGARGVILKVADGGAWFDQGTPAWRIVYELQQRGLVVGVWGYCYGYGRGKQTTEAAIAVEAVTYRDPEGPADYRGPDFYVADVESEWEDGPDPDGAADAFCAIVAAGVPKDFPLAYAPLPVPHLHERLPYLQFARAGWTMLPQTYWTGLEWTEAETLQTLYDDLQRYGLPTSPLFPAYEDAMSSAAADADVAAFGRDVLARGCRGVSVWEYGQMDAGAWQRATQLAAAITAAFPQPQPEPTPDPLAAQLAADEQQIADLKTTIAGWQAWHTAAQTAFARVATIVLPFAQQGKGDE